MKNNKTNMSENVVENPHNRKETGRNKDGTFKKGFTGNPGGRPRSPLKEFSLKEFNSWDEDEKKEFLDKIAPIDRWKMTEGNPANSTDLTSAGEKLELGVVVLPQKDES